jgi:4'-phosphopantetheinyl transferase
MTRRCEDRARLSIGEIHVWTARFVDNRRVTAALLPLLSREERAQAAQFLFEQDRMRFIQAHGRVRQILSDYAKAGAATLAFARNRNGKPCLVPRANGPKLEFSVSHSRDCCMLAVRLDQPIGIDVEKIRDLPRAIDIAQAYFAPAETRALKGLRGTAQRDAFFALWTHKEATVKALGSSLAANLARVEFDLGQLGGPRLAAWDGDQAVAQSWSVLRLAPTAGYVAALATAHPIRSLVCKNWSQRPRCYSYDC